MPLFNTFYSGPPPGNATTPSEQWIDLGTIPTGKRIWFGNATYTAVTKNLTYELRTNKVNTSTGTLTNTTLLSSTSVTVRAGTLKSDYYKNGTLHITSVYGTGVEKFWIRIYSKSSTAASYAYTLNYTTE